MEDVKQRLHGQFSLSRSFERENYLGLAKFDKQHFNYESRVWFSRMRGEMRPMANESFLSDCLKHETRLEVFTLP